MASDPVPGFTDRPSEVVFAAHVNGSSA